MKYLLFLLIFMFATGVGCIQATGDSEGEKSATGARQNELFDLEDVEGMTIAEQDLDVDSRFELSKHTTYFASSPDGIDWTLRKEPIAHYASVPELDVTQDQLGPFPAGTLLTYFVDGTQDHGKEDLELGLVYSLDGGETWSDRLYSTMEGMPENTIVVDPSLVLLEDGRLRLYYFDFPAGVVPGGYSSLTSEFHTAISENGIDFTYEGLVYSTKQTVTDPDVIKFEGLWRMYFMSHADASMVVSVSDDPLAFTTTQKVNDKGIPGVIVVDDEVWLFSCGQDTITRLVSKNGVTFEQVDPAAVSVGAGVHCDPSPARLADGSYGMVFKYISAQDMKQAPRR